MPITVREVLKSAAAMLGDGALIAAADGETSETLDRLVRCFNLVENEVALDYFPLKQKETFALQGGAVSFARFQNAPVDILAVRDASGRALSFECRSGELVVSGADRVEVTYTYAPRCKSENDSSDFSGRVSSRLLALGVATEYLLSSGQYSEAAVFDQRYRDALRAASMVRHKLAIRARRWA